MCSGCSGDYAGGFEFDDPEDRAPDSLEAVARASPRGGPDADLSECRGRGSRGQQDAAEDCEILVTGTQIIEIRVIPANSPANDRLWKMPALETHEPGEHSTGASAKYYQTRQGIEKNRGHAAGSLRISRSVARVCKARFKGWLEGTRRFVRRCTPQSP